MPVGVWAISWMLIGILVQFAQPAPSQGQTEGGRQPNWLTAGPIGSGLAESEPRVAERAASRQPSRPYSSRRRHGSGKTATASFLQGESDWVDPYDDTVRAADDDTYLDLDLYEKMQGRILDRRQVPLGTWDNSPTSDDSLWGILRPHTPDFSFPSAAFPAAADAWQLQWLPDGLVYSPPLADTKASRFGVQFFHERDDGWLYDATLGATRGVFRYGSLDTENPLGFQLDVEGSAQVRLDVPEELDVRSSDYRVGVPLTFATRRWKSRFGYYHLSSHLGDEFLLKNPATQRLNFVRDVIYMNQSFFPTDSWRLYADAGWAFHSDVANEWEFQFGSEYIHQRPWMGGYPYWAVNGRILEELDYGGAVNGQLGWIWLAPNGRRLRAAFHYYNGHSNQWSFYRDHEEQIGIGLWLDR